MNLQKTVFTNKLTTQKYPLLVTSVFFLIIFYIAFFQNHFPKEADFLWYFLGGEQILYGDRENQTFVNAPPIGPVLYSLFNLLFNDPFVTGKTIALLSGTGIVFFSYYIIRNIFGHKIAIVGQLLVAFNPRMDIMSIRLMNEIPPIFFVFASMYFITKKELRLSDIIIAGSLIGVACLFRYQAIMVLFGIMVFLLIRSKNIRTNLSHIAVLGIFFMITFSPVLVYNYTTHGVLIDNSANYELIVKWKYKTPELIEELKIKAIEGAPSDFFIDHDLFFKNYFYNLFYHHPDKLFHFINISNVSVIPSFPFLGFITFAGGLIYLSKIKLNKTTIITLIVTSSITAFLVFLLGEIEIHFFAIIIIPLLVLVAMNIRKIQKNLLPLLFVPLVFLLLMSVLPLSRPDHLFPMWIIFPALGALFFVEVIPKIFSKIKHLKNKDASSKSYNKIIITIIIILVLLVNLAHSYKSIENYFYEQEEPPSSIIGEITKTFQRTGPLVERGSETKQIAEILAKQPGIENSYILSGGNLYLYYVDTKIVISMFQEGVKGDPLDKFITRENWEDYDIWISNNVSYPFDKHNKNKPIPDYLIYYSVPLIQESKYDINATQYEDLKVLADPINPQIPSNFELLYKSNKTNTVVYKIHHDK